MEVNKISEESFQKAMQALGLSKPESKSEEIIKAEKEVQDKAIEKEAIQKELEDTLKKAEDLKLKLAGEEVKKEQPKVETPSIDVELIKGLQSEMLSFKTVVGKTIEEKDELKKALDESKADITLLKSFNEELTARLAKVSKQPMERKSLSGVGAIERFEKAEGADKGKEGFKTLNLNDKKDRAELSDIMFNASIKDGKISDNEFAKAVACVELGSLGSTQAEATKLTRRLQEEHKILVVKK